MKILHIINSLATGGAEKLIVETLPLYRNQGIEADVLVLNGTKHPLYRELEAKNGFRIFSLGESSVYNPLLIFKIIPYLRKYDLIHVHLFPAQYFAVIAKWVSFSNKVFVFTEHNTSNRRIGNKWLSIPEKFIYGSYKLVICITAEIRKVLKKHIDLPDAKLTVIENGINLHTIRESEVISKTMIHTGLSEKDFLLIQVAGFRLQKDQPTVIRSLLHLPENVKLLLVGDGVLRRDCESLVEQFHLTHRVFFLGLRSDVPSLFKSSDLGILSSKWEGFGLVAVEGMASGKPFIASNVPGLAEVVGGAGVLFPAGDDKALSAEILKLMQNKDYYDDVVKKCQHRAQNYDINRMVEQHIDLYRELLTKI